MQKKDAAAIALMVWMLTLSSLLTLLYIKDLRIFVAYALVGFFIIVYMIHPAFSKPGYIQGTYRMVIACIVLFGVVTCLKIRELISG